MTESILKISDLTSGYGDVQVLWGINLNCAKGDIICLVGSNGAGKTTLLRTISGICKAKEGKIFFEGREITSLSPDKILELGIAHVPEGRRLFKGLTVRDNLLLGAYHRQEHKSLIKDDLDMVLDLFPILAERHKQDATTLSGGQQQMCAIARGIMSKPKLLMIDELSLGLAPNLVEHLAQSLVEINSKGTSIILVEQDVMTAFEIAKYGFVIETGKILKEGPTKELYNDSIIREAYLGI
ncbi:MAG: branched-chain amino acid ABC transporter ATP-binding protein [Pelagibacterales bacterium]|nr:branched-chain amino acid ABC transporter ATP-binding protein [Pelagibacterales bacterium]|tara:strand:- start:36 stop:755 length:720 start_codon:yes stop_codon:yes gene_type:complete